MPCAVPLAAAAAMAAALALGTAAVCLRLCFRPRPSRPVIVAIDGTIAVGKSTVCEALRRKGWVVRTEGADDDSRWGRPLRLFYRDPARWTLLLQIAILEDMWGIYRDFVERHADRRAVVVERSPLSADIFVENSLRAGHLQPDEHAVYHRLRRRLGWVPDVVVSLQCPADVSIARVRRRARAAETSVDEGYLRAMDQNYRRRLVVWRDRVRRGELAVRAIHTVDATGDPEEVTAAVEALLRTL